MAWSDKKELTEGQKKAAPFAGIPADRPGLGAEYPKAVYITDAEGTDRTLLGKPLLVQGKYSVRTATVANAEEEAEAIEQGWRLSPDMEAEAKKMSELQERDAEIARLREQLEKSNEMAGVKPQGNQPQRVQGKLTA
jgi:hypothetical protein